MRDIIKRSGGVQPFCGEKITAAMRKAYRSTGTDISEAALAALTAQVETLLPPDRANVEQVQDTVERVLAAKEAALKTAAE